jgi:transposase
VQTNCIKDLLNFKDVEVKKIKNLSDSVQVYVELPKTTQFCPKCGFETSKVHDYYTQRIQDMPIQFKPTTIFYHKRRYECCVCGKKFYEQNELVGKYSRKTTRFVGYVVDELRKLTSSSDIAQKCNTSSNFISRLLPYFCVTNTHLPKVLCIDEFKGNSGNEKYQVALINGETHEVVDIIECRKKHFLCDYFKRFPKEELDNVKFFVTDLWETYKDIAFTYFRKAKIVADHFHWARYACDTVNKIRIEVQNNLPKKERKYFKHSRKLLLSRRCNIKKEDSIDELTYILTNYSENLRIAYREKESLLDILHSDESFEIKSKTFNEWVKRNLESDIPQLKSCAETYQHWYREIVNSLDVPYSNGPTEGFNNKIKVLKRVSFGMRNFNNFKARIMLLNRG